MLMEKLKALQHIFIEERAKSNKWVKTIQLLQKDFKSSKAERIEADNSTCLHSDSFKINKGKLQGVNIDYFGSSLNKVKVSIIQHERKKLNKIKRS